MVVILFLLVVFVVVSCNDKQFVADKVYPPNEGEEIHEGYSTILFMTDLEIIKRATDHLKSNGERVAFKETEISIHHCDTETVICTDPKGKSISYKGDYLKIILYPPTKSPTSEYNKCFTVYLDREGDVLGYTSQILADN